MILQGREVSIPCNALYKTEWNGEKERQVHPVGRRVVAIRGGHAVPRGGGEGGAALLVAEHGQGDVVVVGGRVAGGERRVDAAGLRVRQKCVKSLVTLEG